MPQINLTLVERQALRGEAHGLKPVVMIGGDGLTPAIIQEADAALNAHGLIKIRVFGDDRDARQAMLMELADKLNAAPVQHIGKLLVLHRPKPEKLKLVTREEQRMRPRTVKLVTASKQPNRRPNVRMVTVFGNERVTTGGMVKRARVKQRSTKK
jgi:RNA-binding protein